MLNHSFNLENVHTFCLRKLKYDSAYLHKVN